MKKVKLFFTVGVASAVLSMTSFAGEWKQDASGWWYQNDDGSYSTNTWQEIGGKQYYFDANGYMLHDTTTPDGKQVGSDGSLVAAPLFDFDIEDSRITYTGWKTELENLARIYSVEEGKTITFLDLMRRGIQEKYQLGEKDSE